MKLDITDLLSIEDLTEERQVETELTCFRSKMGSFPILCKSPFVLSLWNQENRRLVIRGETNLTLAIPCGRCLEEVPTEIHLVIDRTAAFGESEEKDEEDEILCGMELDVDKLIYDEILLELPMKVLCREDCKGICTKCGANLNNETCACDRTEPDPRMAAIWDVFNQFKEV